MLMRLRVINLDDEEWKTQTNALHKAVEAFHATLEEDGFDPAYWSLRVEVRRLTTDFEYVVEKQIYDDLQHDVKDLVKHD